MLKKISLLLLLVATPLFAAANQVNLNTASKDELMKNLDGATSKQVEGIIKYRKDNGAFVKLHELTFVDGIDRDFILSNYDRMTVGDATAADWK